MTRPSIATAFLTFAAVASIAMALAGDMPPCGSGCGG